MPYLGWDPFGSRDRLASLWSMTGMPSVTSGAAAGYRTFFTTLRRLVVGRNLTVRLENRRLSLTVTQFDSELELFGLAVGQFGDVVVAARDLLLDEYSSAHASAVLHNVHFHPSSQAQLVAGPVELEVELSNEMVQDLVQRAAPRFTADVGEDGVARLLWARRTGLGSLEVDLDVAGSVLWVKPRALVVRGRRWKLPSRAPRYPVALPELQSGLMVTHIAVQDQSVLLSGMLPEWRFDIPRRRWEDIVTQLSSPAGMLNLARSARPW